MARLRAQHVDLVGLERLERIARIGVIHRGDAVNLRILLPPQRICLQPHAAARRVLRVPVGARAARHAVVKRAGLHHGKGHGVERYVAAVFGIDHQRQIVRRLHAVDHLQARVIGIALARQQEALIAGDHLIGRERNAIMKHHALAQLEGPFFVLHAPAVGQQRRWLALLVQLDHRFKHQLVQADEIPTVAHEGVDLAVQLGHIAQANIRIHIDRRRDIGLLRPDRVAPGVAQGLIRALIRARQIVQRLIQQLLGAGRARQQQRKQRAKHPTQYSIAHISISQLLYC